MKIALLGPISTDGIARFLATPPSVRVPAGYGGAPFMTTLIDQLLKRGHQVCAITTGGHLATRGSSSVRLEGQSFTYYCCPSRRNSLRPSAGRPGRIVDFFAFEREHMVAALNEARPDVVHAHWTYEFAMAAMDSGLPYVVTAHDDPLEVLKMYRNHYRLGRYLMARRVLHNAAVLTAVSNDLKRRVAPLARAEITVVPNPLSRDFIDAALSPPSRARQKRHAIISVINGWSYLKNNKNALLAFAHIRRAFPDATYHLYGSDNEPGGTAERWARTRGVSEGVVFHGPVAHGELIHALRNATLMIHPSRTESFGMAIAEALALGLPAVGGDKSGAIPEMIGDAGLLVNVNDSTAIAGAIVQLLCDEKLYDQCCAAASRRIEGFLPDSVAIQYENIYRKLTKN